MTHPFHPCFGQEIDFVNRQQRWGEDRVLYRDADGKLLWLPARWTSVEPEDPFVIVAAGRSPFRASDLIDLAALVSRLRSRKDARMDCKVDFAGCVKAIMPLLQLPQTSIAGSRWHN